MSKKKPFELLVTKKEYSQYKIVVMAEDVEAALKYAKDNHDWHDELFNCDPCNRFEEVTSLSGKEIDHIRDLPVNYDGSCIPWGADEGLPLSEHFEQEN